ncbi:MAG: hypothetical protein J7L94_12950 [Caldisericaceae bacterium]|nr:hypothetical protein [Caldisericaceae bacterium]
MVEMIVVLIIIGLISSIAYGVILLNAGTFKTLSTEISKRWELRNALRIMRQDFSQIDPANIISFSKSKKGQKKIFFKDIDGNRIFYQYNKGTIRRKKNSEKWEVLATELKTSPFVLLDSKLTQAKNKNEIVFIKINLVAEVNGKIRKVEDTFYLRNKEKENVVKAKK